MVAIRGNSLGHLRYVMKNTLQMMPLYGHYFYAHGCIYVKRGKFNQGKMINALNYLKTDNLCVSISLIIVRNACLCFYGRFICVLQTIYKRDSLK